MNDLEERKKQLALSNAYLAGDKIFGVKFRHNSHASFSNENGENIEGWIVSVDRIEPVPAYTVERSDGQGDEEVLETNMELVFDPHESKT